MKIYYCKTDRGFYMEGFHSFIPENSIEISNEEYNRLFLEQSQGKEIDQNEEGYPYTRDPVPKVVTWESIRAQRNSLLAKSDWSQLPDTPSAIKQKWSSYRQTLRDLPQSYPDPQSVVWPSTP